MPRAVDAMIEVRGDGAQPLADRTEPDPAIFGFHLLDGAYQQGDRGARWLQCTAAPVLLGRAGGFRHQVLGVDEAAAGLTEALRRLLRAEAVDVGALLAQTRSQSRKIAVGRDQAGAVDGGAA